MSLSVSQLRILDALARTGGIGTAARDLGISQPTVSQQLRQLEDRLSLKLFQRDGHKLSPSPVLLTLLPRIRTALTLMEEIEMTLARTSTLESGQLSIGYSTHQFVMPILSRFIDAFPGVRISARSQATHDLLTLLESGEIEVAFVTLRQPLEGYTCVELRRDRIVIMARADDPLAGQGPVTWETLRNRRLLRREESSGTRRVFDAAALAAEATIRNVLDLGSWESMRQAVLAGIGLGVALEGELETGDAQLVALPIDDSALEVGHYIMCLSEMVQVAPVAALFSAAGAGFETGTPENP